MQLVWLFAKMVWLFAIGVAICEKGVAISFSISRAKNKSLEKAQNSRNYSMEGGDRKHAAIVLSYSSLKMGRKIRIQIEL